MYLSTKMKRKPAATNARRTPARRVSGPRVERAAETQDGALKLWVVLARAYAAVLRHSAADIARYDLTGAEFGILEALYHKGPLLLGEIQRKILVSSGGITYLVDRLVEKGLVQRQDCPDDRRARYAVLTPAGDALIRRVFPEHAASIARALAALTPQEQAQATALLRTLGHGAAELPSAAAGD